MARPYLTLILGHGDLAAQAAHLARGALFLPEPDPLPEPFADIVLRVEAPSGASVELPARVLQILAGHGIAVSFDDLAGARSALAPLFAEPAGAEEGATFLFWGRIERSVRPEKVTAPAPPPPPPESPAAAEADAHKEDVPKEIELDEITRLEAEIAQMNTNQKMQLGMRGNRTARMLLLKDVNKNLQTFVLQNPRITLDEVRALAASRQATADVLNTIAANKDWGNNPNVVLALVRNPKTASGTAVKLVEKVPIAEARRLAKGTDVPRVVATAAKRRVAGDE